MPALPAINTGAGTQAYAPLDGRAHSHAIYSPSPTLTHTVPSIYTTSTSSSTVNSLAEHEHEHEHGHPGSRATRAEGHSRSPITPTDNNHDAVGLGIGYVDTEREEGAATPTSSSPVSRQSDLMRSESEETLSATRSNTVRASKGKGRATVDGRGQWLHEQEHEHEHEHAAGDVGEYHNARGGTRSHFAGRDGAARDGRRAQGDPTWDEEQGRVEDVYGSAGRYPPTNEEEEEEKRIQDNLARMAARDQARRRASRLSRQISTSPLNTPDLNEGGGGFSATAMYRRPLSMLGVGGQSGAGAASGGVGDAGKRGSILGFVQGLWSPNGRDLERIDDSGEVPLGKTISRLSSNSSTVLNPFEPPSASRPPSSAAPLALPDNDALSPSSSSSSARSPFADPPVPSGSKPYSPNGRTHARQLSSASAATEQGFAYTGPGWRGGGIALRGAEGQYVDEGKEKWWHALCAWGDGLDGGHGNEGDGQAGRTNPME